MTDLSEARFHLAYDFWYAALFSNSSITRRCGVFGVSRCTSGELFADATDGDACFSPWRADFLGVGAGETFGDVTTGVAGVAGAVFVVLCGELKVRTS